jgi:ribonuclease HI
MRAGRVRIFFDGGSRPNPGPIETAVVARGVAYVRTDAGHGDSSLAEWLALLDAVEVALTLGADDVEFAGDSRLVVAQASGALPCRRADLRDCLAAYRHRAAAIGATRVRHVARSHNLAGIALARRHPR